MRMNKRYIRGFAWSLAVSAIWSMTALAGEWRSDSNGWWYQNDDGSYPKDQWQEINGEYYFFKSDGYMLADAMTPDGYFVDSNGAWIRPDEQSQTVRDNTILFLAAFADTVYKEKINDAENPVNINMSVSDIDAQGRAFMLYYYQYLNEDSRITSQGDYNLMTESGMTEIINELFCADAQDKEEKNTSAVKYFIQNYTEGAVNQQYKINAVGDFGDAGSYYFSNSTYTFENGLLKISGDVMVYSSAENGYVPGKTFTAYYTPGSGSCYEGYSFYRLTVQ